MKAIVQQLKRSRESFLDRHHDGWHARVFSAETLVLDRLIRRLTAEHVAGLTLDAGCGRGTYRKCIQSAGGVYEAADLDARGGFEPTYRLDLCHMTPLENDRFVTVACHQVLEHIAEPSLAVAEFFRVLKPSGKAIVTVPHLSRYHELPSDYFRYTEFGLQVLFTKAGFEVVEAGTYGNVFSFLHHQSSFFFPGLLMGIPVIREAALGCNAVLSHALCLSERLLGNLRMPLGCYGVFVKPNQETPR